MHQVKRCGIKTDWRVVDRRKTDPEQLTLACQAQIGVLFTDHLAAFSGAHRFSPCYKIILRRQLPDLGVQVLDFPILILSLLDLVGENACHAFNRLPFPCAHLRKVQSGLGRSPALSCNHAEPQAPQSP